MRSSEIDICYIVPIPLNLEGMQSVPIVVAWSKVWVMSTCQEVYPTRSELTYVTSGEFRQVVIMQVDCSTEIRVRVQSSLWHGAHSGLLTGWRTLDKEGYLCWFVSCYACWVRSDIHVKNPNLYLNGHDWYCRNIGLRVSNGLELTEIWLGRKFSGGACWTVKSPGLPLLGCLSRDICRSSSSNRLTFRYT